MCGPGFVVRAADSGDLAGVAAVAAETGVPLADAREHLDRQTLLVAVSAGEVIGLAATGEPDGSGVATLVGPMAGAAGFGLGVEKALLRRAVEQAAGRGVRVLCAHVPAGDPVRAQTFVAQGFQRKPQPDVAGAFAFTKTL